MTRQVFVQHPDTGKLVPLEEVDWPRHKVRTSKSFQIMEDIEPFVSPVDGSIVTSRSKLREHNNRNGVVNYHEFDGQRELDVQKREEFLKGESKEHRKDLLKDVIEATNKVESGYKPQVQSEGELE